LVKDRYAGTHARQSSRALLAGRSARLIELFE
jgi:hypothetical protein